MSPELLYAFGIMVGLCLGVPLGASLASHAIPAIIDRVTRDWWA